MQETDIKPIITQSLTETVVNSIKEMNIILGENIRGLMQYQLGGMAKEEDSQENIQPFLEKYFLSELLD